MLQKNTFGKKYSNFMHRFKSAILENLKNCQTLVLRNENPISNLFWSKKDEESWLLKLILDEESWRSKLILSGTRNEVDQHQNFQFCHFRVFKNLKDRLDHAHTPNSLTFFFLLLQPIGWIGCNSCNSSLSSGTGNEVDQHQNFQLSHFRFFKNLKNRLDHAHTPTTLKKNPFF